MLTVEEIHREFAGQMFRDWSKDDLRAVLERALIRDRLNRKLFYSIGGGEYYDMVNGTDKEIIQGIMERQSDAANARIRSLNKNRTLKGMPGQFEMRFFFDDFEGYREVV